MASLSSKSMKYVPVAAAAVAVAYLVYRAGQTDQPAPQPDQPDDGGGGGAPNQSLRPLTPERYVVEETADLEESNDQGTVNVAPGDEAVIARHTSSSGMLLLAAGAKDEPGVRYRIVVDGKYPVGGLTQAPLGTITSPFSFVEKLDGAIPAEKSVEYRAIVDPEVSSPVELGATLHVDDLPGGEAQ